MIIDVARLDTDGEALHGEEPSSILHLETDRDYRPDGPIRYDLRAQVLYGELLVRGTLRLNVAMVCSQCAEPFTTEVTDPEFTFLQTVTGDEESVDLTDDIREAMLLAFPNYPVCKPECRGLCPRCGVNRNRKACSCKPEAVDSRWNALGTLELKVMRERDAGTKKKNV